MKNVVYYIIKKLYFKGGYDREEIKCEKYMKKKKILYEK